MWGNDVYDVMNHGIPGNKQLSYTTEQECCVSIHNKNRLALDRVKSISAPSAHSAVKGLTCTLQMKFRKTRINHLFTTDDMGWDIIWLDHCS